MATSMPTTLSFRPTRIQTATSWAECAAEELDDKGYITRKDRKALIEAAEEEPLHPADFEGIRR